MRRGCLASLAVAGSVHIAQATGSRIPSTVRNPSTAYRVINMASTDYSDSWLQRTTEYVDARRGLMKVGTLVMDPRGRKGLKRGEGTFVRSLRTSKSNERDNSVNTLEEEGRLFT